MNHDHAQDTQDTTAALYAAGALPAGEEAVFSALLDAGQDFATREVHRLDSVIRALATAIPPVPPPRDVRLRLLQRITDEKAAPSAESAKPSEPDEPPVIVQRATDDVWEKDYLPGVDRRVLHFDPVSGKFSVLIRMQPGSIFPEHDHHGDEECLVLEGDLCVGEIVLGPGDFQRSPRGSRHVRQFSRGGCLALVTGTMAQAH